MRAALIHGAGDIRVEDVPDPQIRHATDAVVRVTASCICGSDLHHYHSRRPSGHGATIGHEFIGVVEQVGPDVVTVRPGDFVIAPFAWSDGTCDYCRAGLQTSCRNGGYWNDPRADDGGVGGGQAEAVRVPQADGTLVRVPVEVDEAMLPSLLTLSDVLGTGHYAALRGGVTSGSRVTVIGDGAVGLLAVLAARRLGAEQVILMGRHRSRTDLGVELGATDVVAERGEEGVERVRALTGGDGTPVVIEAVGLRPAYDQAVGVVAPGGTISRVGVPQYAEAPIGSASLFSRNITLTGGPAPVRATMEELLPDVLDGTIDPGRVLDSVLPLDEAPAGYRAMDARESLKVMLLP